MNELEQAGMTISGDPHLGNPGFMLRQATPIGVAPIVGGETAFGLAEPVGAPIAEPTMATATELILEELLAEVRGLRADLASRTLRARLSRLWSTIRTWLRTIRTGS